MAAKEKEQPKEKTNATLRLSVVLDAMGQADGNSSVADALTSVLKITDDDSNRANLLAFAILTRMIESAEKEARLHYSDEWEQVGAPHFAGIRACFTPRKSGAAWSQHRANLTAADLTGIRHTAVHLKRHVHEISATDAEMADVFNAIEEMSQTLDDEALSKHTREVLQERLDAIKRAVEEYRFWGASGVDQAYRQFMGTLVTDATLQNDLTTSAKNDGHLWKKVKKVAKTVALFLSIVSGISQMSDKCFPTIEKLLLPEPPISSPIIDAPHIPIKPSTIDLSDLSSGQVAQDNFAGYLKNKLNS
jgi:hypothetical protein